MGLKPHCHRLSPWKDADSSNTKAEALENRLERIECALKRKPVGL
jgi:hypothetical protein